MSQISRSMLMQLRMNNVVMKHVETDDVWLSHAVGTQRVKMQLYQLHQVAILNIHAHEHGVPVSTYVLVNPVLEFHKAILDWAQKPNLGKA